MVGVHVAVGVPVEVAVPAVLAYRAVALWLPAAGGLAGLAVLRCHLRCWAAEDRRQAVAGSDDSPMRAGASAGGEAAQAPDRRTGRHEPAPTAPARRPDRVG